MMIPIGSKTSFQSAAEPVTSNTQSSNNAAIAIAKIYQVARNSADVQKIIISHFSALNHSLVSLSGEMPDKLQEAIVVLITSKVGRASSPISSTEIHNILEELKALSAVEIALVITDYQQGDLDNLLTRGIELYIQNNPSDASFIRFPDDIKSSIFQYLDSESCWAMRQASIKANELINKLWVRIMSLYGIVESKANEFYMYYKTLDVPLLTIEVRSIKSDLFNGLIQSLSENERITEVKLNVLYHMLNSTNIPPLAKLIKLIKLDISGNDLADNASQLQSLTNLTWLDISNNKLESIVTAQLTNLTKLITLYIGDNGLLADGVAYLGNLTNLEILDIANNALGSLGGTQLANLTNLKKLTNLDICDNDLASEDVAHLAYLTNLTELNIGANSFEPDGAAYLGNLTKLKSLIIFGSHLGPNGAAHLVHLTNLTNLVIRNNNLRPNGAAYLANLTNLTTLDIGANELGPQGTAQLTTLKQLTSLDIDDNNLGIDGAAHITNLTNLTELHIGSNELGPQGAAQLTTLPKLTSLEIDNNNLGIDGAAHITNLTNLTKLRIGFLDNLKATDFEKEYFKLKLALPEFTDYS